MKKIINGKMFDTDEEFAFEFHYLWRAWQNGDLSFSEMKEREDSLCREYENEHKEEK